MKRLVWLFGIVAFVLGLSLTAFAAKETFDAKAGDTIYVCGCGKDCDCGTISKNEGKCTCNKKLVKTTVVKVEGGKVFYKVNGNDLSAPVTGKYYCACEGCDCNTVSQKPGKCSCGKKLMEMKKP